MGKTVYILGAGFSKSVGAPLQSEIIKEILNLPSASLDERYRDLFQNLRTEFIHYLKNILFISDNIFYDVSLEDIFTPIDRCLLDNISLRGLNKFELIKFRQALSALIVILMNHKLKSMDNLGHIKVFNDYLIRTRKVELGADPFTIISTNWDIILENQLFKEMNSSKEKGVIDYCFYVHSYDQNEFGKKLRSGLYDRGKGLYNIKVLKLHGSMNWLQCQRCQRIYLTFFQKIALDEFILKPKCRYCEQTFRGENSNGRGAFLLSQLIMPTFLKDLNIYQLKLIWQIAGIELSEASKLVFMGYSFPTADFEIRQLLVRSLRKDIEIDVVLTESDRPINFKPHYTSPEFRYRSFFGKRKTEFFYDGVKNYIEHNYS